MRNGLATLACDITWKQLFDDRMEDRDSCDRRVQRARRTREGDAPKSRLLVFEAKQGWEPLCRFLGVDVPDEPYPRVNTTDDFMNRTPRSHGSEVVEPPTATIRCVYAETTRAG